MIQEELHKKILDHCDVVANWYEKKRNGLAFPIYSSFDVRDSGCKVVPVDANLFPAGFNNICQVDKDHAPEIMRIYLKSHYGELGSKVALLAEEHTSNTYYWENIATIQDIIAGAGYDPLVCVPRDLVSPVIVKSVSGREVAIHSGENRAGQLFVDGEKMDLIVCNNDFSQSYEPWSEGLQTPMNPPRELGWYRRRKHSFFALYNGLAAEFAQIIGYHPNMLQIETDLFSHFDVNDRESVEKLASAVDGFLARLREKYKSLGMKEEPFCFVKNNAGTYGLAVTQVRSGSEVLEWNSKTRSKMRAAKGGREVSELIIQEGVATRFREDDGGSAEPCIYLVGCQLVGGFLRAHAKKGPDESLNSPGAVYKRLCISDLEIKVSDCPMENVYGWTSKLSVLALALEAKESGVEFRGYQ